MKTAILISAILIIFSSCEGILHMQGFVYDNDTKKPVDNAQVVLVLARKDTVRNIYFEYDTVSYNQRMALRKAGVKDDYGRYNVGGFSKKPSPAITDTSGHFSVGSILIACVPKCPKCQLIFIKDGYKPLILKPGSIVNDSIKVCLERGAPY